MVARLEADGDLGPGPVREALLALPREVLMPQAYVRRSAADEMPPRWELLDWAEPDDREELLAVLHGGQSVLIQHDGEPLLGRPRRGRSGGGMTSMSTVMSLTSSLLEELALRQGHRVLDIGTGAGVTTAVACHVCGDQTVVTLDRDPHVTEAARARLGALGYGPTLVSGNGEHGWPQQAPYDRILITYALPYVPQACVDQLAPGGRLLVHVTTSSPSWPALAVVTRKPDGRLQAQLRAVEYAHRAGHGMNRLYLSAAFRQRIAAGCAEESEARAFRSVQAPPPDEARGFWLALDALHPGLVRHWGAGGLVSAHLAAAPGCLPTRTALVPGASPPAAHATSGAKFTRPPHVGGPPARPRSTTSLSKKAGNSA